MFVRSCLRALLPIGIVLTFVGCTSTPGLDSIQVTPATQSLVAGQTTQLTAIGTYGNASHPSTQNVTTLVNWTSNTPTVASVNPTTGLVTGQSAGTATITATAAGFAGTVSASSVITVTAAGGGSAGGDIISLTILPADQSLSATGQTGQFIALGTVKASGVQVDLTNLQGLVWTSTIPTVATVTTGLLTGNGVAMGKNPGTTTITAEWTNTSDGSVVANTAGVTVTAAAAPEPLLSLVILPSSITISDLYGTGQFLAYGTFSTAPTVQDLTNSPTLTWISTAPFIFPINNSGAPGATAGLVTANGSGTDVIYAVAKNPDGTLVYSPPVAFNCPLILANLDAVPPNPGSCNGETIAPSLLSTLTVFNAGLNTTSWLITADSATGTKNVIHCGPGSTAAGLGSSVCEATYPNGTIVTLTAPAGTGQFGGWSSNCLTISPDPSTAAGPNTCTIQLGTGESSNVSVGAIFN
jgi:uncharacterized protein YjdB